MSAPIIAIATLHTLYFRDRESSVRSCLYYKVCISTHSCVICYCLYIILYYIIICSYMFAIMIQEERKWSIKDYICGCNRLIERLWVSKWSWSSVCSCLYYKVCISTNSCVICFCFYIILLCVHEERKWNICSI